jgi:hypothetical protein
VLLAPQTSFDLCHQVCGEPQVIEGLLEGRGGVLCLAAVTLKALLCGVVATLPGFHMFFNVSWGEGHGVLLVLGVSAVVTVCQSARDTYLLISVSRTSPRPHTLPRLPAFFDQLCYGIHALERPVPFPHRLVHAASAERGVAMTFEEILAQAMAMLQR